MIFFCRTIHWQFFSTIRRTHARIFSYRKLNLLSSFVYSDWVLRKNKLSLRLDVTSKSLSHEWDCRYWRLNSKHCLIARQILVIQSSLSLNRSFGEHSYNMQFANSLFGPVNLLVLWREHVVQVGINPTNHLNFYSTMKWHKKGTP